MAVQVVEPSAPAILSYPTGSMGEEVEPMVCPAIKPHKTLAQWHAEFPSLTRTEGTYRPWDKAQGVAS